MKQQSAHITCICNRPPALNSESLSVIGEDINKIIVTQESYLKLYQEGGLKGHKVSQKLLNGFNKNETTTEESKSIATDGTDLINKS